MVKIRTKIAFVLLAIYGIVFAHNVIPHHHHLDIVTNMVAMFTDEECSRHHHHHHEVNSQNHTHYNHSHHQDEKVKHQHDHEQHAACHFDVRPVASKTVVFYAVLVVNSTFQLRVPVKEIPKLEIEYSSQKLPEGYNFAVPLRAPPVFA